MSSTSLYSMFDEPLPQCFIEPSSSAKRQTKESSAKVKEKDPPQTLVASEVAQYYNKGREYLEKHRNVLSSIAAPTPESSRVLRNESDVVFHGCLALVSILTPVFEQNDLFCGKVHVHAEVGTSGLWPDLSIQYEAKRKKKYIVMVEFKRTEFLKESELRDFLYQEHELKPGTLQPKVSIYEKELDHHEEVSIVMQIKQNKAYTAGSTCIYIALCDYFSLFLFKFSENLEVAWVTVVQPKDFRKAFLGFCLKAIEDS